MTWDLDLYGVHREIAAEEGTPIHVLAGPGTGKTYAMIRRIAKFLEDGVSGNRILSVTFTRTAARDLREQLQNLEILGADQVVATTLHSLCFSALSKEEVFNTIGRVARPLLSYEIKQLINDLAQSFGGKKRTKVLLTAFEAAWARMQNEEAGVPRNPVDVLFQVALISWLRFHKAMLIGELVPLSLSFVRDNPAIPIFPEFDHVLVDEYQDLNKSDQELVQTLSLGRTLSVIGDDNQSIYSFRYANPEGIRNFTSNNPTAVPFVINECRRCPGNIVSISNSLISYDPLRSRPTPLIPVQDRPNAEIYIVQHNNNEDETESIADYINSRLNTDRDLRPGQVLVLATRRYIGNKIRQALIQRRLNSLSYFFEDELDQDSAAEGMCLLKLLVEPNDRAALRAWIGIPSSDGFSKSYARIMRIAQDNGIEPRAVLDQLVQNQISIPYTDKVKARYSLLLQRLANVDGLTGLTLVRSLWDINDEQSLDIRLLAESIALSNPLPQELLESLLTAITQPVLPGADSDIIRVMSLHKSKGLTAKIVIVAGCVAGAMPTLTESSDTPIEAQYNEQRRLFYVAITRATSTLVISSSASMLLRDAMASGVEFTRKLPYGRVMTPASPFITELGATAPATINTQAWRTAARF